MQNKHYQYKKNNAKHDEALESLNIINKDQLLHRISSIISFHSLLYQEELQQPTLTIK